MAENVEPGAKVYTDDHGGYVGLPNHETVRHSVAEYVKGQAHTNGIESFWATLKRAHKGVFHKMSPKHLQRYVTEFAGKHNVRDEDNIRIAVVNRKTCGGGNRTAKGAQAQSILMSVLQSCRHKGIRVIDIVTSILRAPDNTPVPLVNPER